MPANLKTHSICWRLGPADSYPAVILRRDSRIFSLSVIDRKCAFPVTAILTKRDAAKLVEAIEAMSQCSWRDASARASTLGNVVEKRS